MKKALKELIEKAEPYQEGVELAGLYIINSGEAFWRSNGYNNIIVVGYKNPNKHYLLTAESDVVNVRNIRGCNIDISTELGCVRIWFDQPLKVPFKPLSSCFIAGV